MSEKNQDRTYKREVGRREKGKSYRDRIRVRFGEREREREAWSE